MSFLPDDVFLVVVGHTDIDTFLNIRLLSRHVGALIKTHIHGITASVARSTFPRQTRILMHAPDESSNDADCLRWLKDLRYQQLAAIVVERQMPGAEITAEDPLGDDLRRAIAKGWRVLTHCSRIASEMTLVPSEQLPQRSSNSARRDCTADAAEIEALREIEAYRRYSLYFETLQIEDMKGYQQLQNTLVLEVFGFKWHGPVALGTHKDLPGNKENEQWVSSCLLRLGAQPFWQAWWASGALSMQASIKETVEAAWDLRNDAARLSERQKAEVLKYQIWTMACDIEYRLWSRTPTQHRVPPEVAVLMEIPASYTLSHQRMLLTEQGEELPPRAFDSVRFAQTLDARIIGIAAYVPLPDRRPNVAVCCGPNLNPRRIPSVTKEYEQLFTEWEEGWRTRHGYTSGTPNGQKISCTLEELGVNYETHNVHIAKNEQKEDWYLEINPNGRIPAIVDKSSDKPQRVFEGAAIQLYLCAKYDTDHRISFAYDTPEYWEMLSWLTWMQSGIGPMQGQANHFYRYAPTKIDYAITRYQTETKRLYQVLNDRLKTQQDAGARLWLAGGKYTIADLCCFSRVNWAEWAGVETKPFPELQRWLETIQQRPAVQRGVDVPEPFEMKEKMKTKEGEAEYAKHHSNWVMQGMEEDKAKHS
ncbi:Glutathione S-transferase 2 [Elasticomyces elasticus]|nr:Glutathione S-transferase 2 [Elasticomyces elasticus]KAK4910346.1 Glutathione S-transferase 2 [Elasticomyces elasticus]KAK5763600.1 Glutathione S-transferase 2 [Elasticomyces elasticus]